MDIAIKKKNLRARKGKQRWRRNIDVTELENQQLKSQFTQQPFGQKDKKQETLGFTIETEAKQNIYENKDRFKKQPIDPKVQSKNEKKIIDKFAKMIKQNEPQNQEEQKIQDPWGEVMPQLKKSETLDRPKFMVIPKGGQSYNPSMEQYQNLLDSEVKRELESNKKQRNTQNEDAIGQKLKEREIQRIRKAKLSKIHREQGQEVLDHLNQKRINHEFTLLKKIKKEIKDKDEELQRRQTQRKQEQLAEQIAFKEGKLLKPRKMGKTYIKNQPEDFLLEEELPEKLRHLTNGDRIVRNQFNSIFRRGLLEPRGPSNKLSKSKMAKFRIKEHTENEEKQEKEFQIKK